MPIKLVKRPKSPFWVMRGTIRGIRVEETTGTADKKVAEEVRAKREAKILEQSIHGRVATVTFAEAALSYIDHGGSKRFLDKVVEHFTTTPLAKIDQEAIDTGAAKIYPNASPATRNRQFYTPVSAVMTHAAKRKWCSPLILERPKVNEVEVRWLKPEEAERLIAACSKHFRPLVIFLLYTGARAGEALWLDWRNVNLSAMHTSFPKTKNGEARGVPLHPRVVATLANLKGREGEVFRRPDGEPYERPDADDEADTSAGSRIKTAFRAACRRAKITNFHPHACRHTWATWHYAANRDLRGLQKLGGWKSIELVERYAHVNVDELRHTIDALPWTGGNSGETLPGEKKTT